MKEFKLLKEDIISKIKSAEDLNDSVIIVYDHPNEKNKYKPYRFNASKEERSEIIQELVKKLQNIMTDHTIENYDLELSSDDTIQLIESSKVEQFTYIKEYITTNSKMVKVFGKDTKINKFHFFAAQATFAHNGEENKITFFRRYFKNSKNFNNSFTYSYDGKTLKPFKKEIIALNIGIDAFLLEDKFYILNRNAFNSIFKFKDFYKRVIEDNSENFIKSEMLTNSNNFIKDCQEDGRYIKRLSKFMIVGDYKSINSHRNNIKSIIKNYKLKIVSDKEKKIIYRGKDDINEILNLLLEHYVVSALTEKRLLAKAIEEYEV